MRANLTVFLGVVVLVAGVVVGIEAHTWRGPLYGVLGMLLLWCSLWVVPAPASTCQFCGREEK